MWSWLFGGRKATDTRNGSGYGGSSRHDRTSLLKGRERAAQEASAHDKATLEFLAEIKPLLSTKSVSSSDTTAKLVSTLKEVFRNQVPADWGPKRELFMESLACYRLVVTNYNELLGDKGDSESLIAAFHDFAEHVDFLWKKGRANEHSVLVNEVIAVRTFQPQVSTAQPSIQAATDPRELYRSALRPLRFDFVDKLEHHRYASQRRSGRLNMRKVFQELSSYKTSLPIEYGSSIVVRAVEDRVDLLRAMIIGPEDTPYANGCFFFDIHLGNYPNEAPSVRFLTTGGGKVRFNPNLYASGKVCLSLLGTWFGPGWVSGESTLLQVLISLQSMVFVAHPFFNEPLTTTFFGGSPFGNKKSDEYNQRVRNATVIHAIKPFVSGNHAYPEFAKAIQAHFCNKKMQLEAQLRQWMSLDGSLTSTVERIQRRLARLDNTEPSRAAARVRKGAHGAQAKGMPPAKKSKTRHSA